MYHYPFGAKSFSKLKTVLTLLRRYDIFERESSYRKSQKPPAMLLFLGFSDRSDIWHIAALVSIVAWNLTAL